MSDIERTIRNAGTKAELHQMIDALPDTGTAVLITRSPSTDADGDPSAIIGAMCYPYSLDTFELIGQMEQVKHRLLHGTSPTE